MNYHHCTNEEIEPLKGEGNLAKIGGDPGSWTQLPLWDDNTLLYWIYLGSI